MRRPTSWRPATAWAHRWLGRWTAPSESDVLGLSAVLTLGLAVFGVIFGWAVGSQAIVFDGVFELIDASMSALAMATAALVVREGNRRFQYGYWHLEPLVAAFNGAVLALLCLYAFVNAVQALISGEGRPIAWQMPAIYSSISCVVSLALYAYQRRVNRRLKSVFITIDADGFLISALISVGVFIGFALAAFAGRFGWDIVARNADSAVLLVLALGLLPLPVRILRDALREIFLITPDALHCRVRAAVDPVIVRHRLIGYNITATRRKPGA